MNGIEEERKALVMATEYFQDYFGIKLSVVKKPCPSDPSGKVSAMFSFTRGDAYDTDFLVCFKVTER